MGQTLFQAEGYSDKPNESVLMELVFYQDQMDHTHIHTHRQIRIRRP